MDNKSDITKKHYSKPGIVILGDVRRITQGGTGKNSEFKPGTCHPQTTKQFVAACGS